jgi:hypothetical protein
MLHDDPRQASNVNAAQVAASLAQQLSKAPARGPAVRESPCENARRVREDEGPQRFAPIGIIAVTDPPAPLRGSG